MFFKESAEYSSSVFGSDRKYWSQKKKTALGLIGVEGFPFQISPLKTKKTLPIPAVEFTEPAPSIAKIFNQNRINAMPDEFFTTKFRGIFQQTRLKHTTAAEAKTWLRGPNLKYWNQLLSFAVFCATQGCGISREVFDSGFSLTPQIRACYQFHVYFTIRRILYQLGGIQNMSARPGDPTCNQFTIIMTHLLKKEYAPSSELIHQAIFALHTAKTTVLVTYTFMHKNKKDKNGLRWNFTSVLEGLDFADDIALISSKYEHIQSKWDRLVENAGRVGLKLNAAKCKMMRSNARRQDRVKIGEDEVEEVEEFVYLGATVRKDGGGTEDIRNRLNKARRAFYNLTKIWRLRSIGRQTKIKLFKTLVRPVLLYGCEAWKMTKVEEKKMDAFQFVCLRRILGIRWPQRVSNERIGE